MFCDSKYATDKDTIKSVSGLVTTLGGTLLIRLSKIHRNLRLSSTEAEFDVFSAFSQDVKFVSMLLVEMTKVKNLSIIYENDQSTIFLENTRQVGICTRHIDIFHHFM